MANENQSAQGAEKTKKFEYDAALAAKYDISTMLQPAPIDLGARYGRIEVDLRKAGCVEVIDAFVEKYKDQPFFKKKGSPAAKPANQG